MSMPARSADGRGIQCNFHGFEPLQGRGRQAAHVHGLAGSCGCPRGSDQLLPGGGGALPGSLGRRAPPGHADLPTALHGSRHGSLRRPGPGATNFSTATRDSEPPVSDRQHDMARALEAWVETGTAPEELIATHYETASPPTGASVRAIAFQRPLCVFPQVARYNGGPTHSADSFSCVMPKP